MSRVLLPVLLVVSSLAAAPAGGLEPKRPSDVVRISQTGAPCPFFGFAIAGRVLPGGGGAQFTIPDGQVLVVTGLEWSGTSGTPGARVTLGLTTQTAEDVVAVYTSSTTFASDGVFFRSEVTPPLVLASGRTICMALTAGAFSTGTVHGFLAPDK